jgi:hypothetical protein
MSRKRLVLTCGMFGFLIAIAFAAVRLYMLGHQSLYEGALYGGWFDTLTLIFWPGSRRKTNHRMECRHPLQYSDIWRRRLGNLAFSTGLQFPATLKIRATSGEAIVVSVHLSR